MKKIRPRFKLLLLCLLLIVGAVSLFMLPSPVLATRQENTARATIDKVTEVFESAKPIHDELIIMVGDLIDSEDSDEELALDIAEFEAELEELSSYTSQLDELLSELSALPDDIKTSEGKTVLAAREYITMLKNMFLDLIVLSRYTIDLYTAVIGLEELSDSDASLLQFATDWWDATQYVLEQMEEIFVPDYLALSHEDLTKYMREFNELGADFYHAADIDDPLRINSCIARLGRIERMFDRCFVNLMDDLELQSRQAESRLEGPIQLLRDELEQNLNLLKAA